MKTESRQKNKNYKTAKIVAMMAIGIITAGIFAIIMFFLLKKQHTEKNEIENNKSDTNKNNITTNTDDSKIFKYSHQNDFIGHEIVQKIPNSNIEVEELNKNEDKIHNNTKGEMNN